MGIFSRKQQRREKSEAIAPQSQADNVANVQANQAAFPTEETLNRAAGTAQFLRNSDREHGPFDQSELSDLGKRLDAGSLWLPVIPQAQLQFSTDETQQLVLGVVYVIEDSALQLQAFAAPKSKGIWDEVRLDMRTSIAQQGGSSQEQVGPFGKELFAMMPLAGTKNFAPHRFLGIDGPRWLLRATLYGRAGADERAAAPLLEILQDIVVVRGREPLVPRSLLPLRIPSRKA